MFLQVSLFSLYLSTLFFFIECNLCDKIQVTLTQSVENEGYHRLFRWLIEFKNSQFSKIDGCVLVLKQDIPNGAFVNPDQIADLVNVGSLQAIVEGFVDVEQPAHHSDLHIAYVYSNISNPRLDLYLPMHLRYHRPQIGQDYSKIEFMYPWILIQCHNLENICSNKIKAPSLHSKEMKLWANLSYNSISEPIQVFVPVGDLDHYPIVSIVTFLVTCSACIYLLSVMLSKSLPHKNKML